MYNAQKCGPDVVILMGDILDFHRISRYPNDEGTLSFAEEIRVGLDLLYYFRQSFPNADFYYIEGNHEVRLAHYIQRNASELTGLESLEMANLLHMKELEITFLQMGFVHCGDMTFLHGHELPGIGGGQPIAQAVCQDEEERYLWAPAQTRELLHPRRVWQAAAVSRCWTPW